MIRDKENGSTNVQFQLQRLIESKSRLVDRLMKNKPFVFWLCWGLGLVLQDKTPEQMFSYVQSGAPLEELGCSVFVRKNPAIDESVEETYISRILEQAGDEELWSSPVYAGEDPAERRSWDRSFSLALSFELQIVKRREDSSLDIRKVTMWLFPEAGDASNSVLTIGFDKTETVSFKKCSQDDLTLPETDTYCLILGPEENVRDPKPGAPLPQQKQRTLLRFLDLLFETEVDDERANLQLKPFGLSGDILETVKRLSAVMKQDFERLYD